ncbi:nucleotidyltransferase family protein [uncultured Ezakiella sp.]|uniref:nucleotidyltransferase family protein n=1 Tax=uncultured Ezakiella sp. TaxID=1637529 RepID=UPI0025E4E390|nr:nucleotidyltransferase family protein [uncultured Ezakiella sp.]
MRIGIIAEFNPFHKGHLHLINTIKDKNTSIISIMSGDYVVRGEFAITNKFSRASAAYKNGVDTVFELASVFSLQNGEIFSRNSIRHLLAIGIDGLAFGAENPDLKFLYYLADIVSAIDEDLASKKIVLKDISYSNYIRDLVLKETGKTIGSNDMLASEYIKELKRLNAPIKIIPIKRIVSPYNHKEESDYSASSIRQRMYKNGDCLSNECLIGICKTIGMSKSIDTEDLDKSNRNRIYDSIFYAETFDDIIENSAHKTLNRSRIRRAILKAILGISAEIEEKYYDSILIKPLAISKSADILNSINKSFLYTQYKDLDRLNSLSKDLYLLNESHSEFYHSLSDHKKLLDRTQSPFI